MLQNIAELKFLLPEIILLIAACALLIFSVCKKNHHINGLLIITLSFLVIAMGAIFFVWPEANLSLLSDFEITYRTQSMKIVSIVFMLFGFIYNRVYIHQHNMGQGEYYVLSLFMLLGAMVLISANNLLTLYLGLELIALPLYALVAFDKSGLGAEAAMKYFILGALASGLLLYGISLIFGATGYLNLQDIAINISKANIYLLTLGWVFVFVGLVFKLGAVPFHAWLPDVYQGAPTPITLFLSGAPKIAILVMLLRGNALFSIITPYWSMILIGVAFASMLIGTLFAIAQTNFKRMLGYSAIANLGFIFCAMLNTVNGDTAALYYLIIYALAAMGCLGIVNTFNLENINDFKGMSKKEPLITTSMAIYMFSMIGLPPLAGFYAKFIVLNELLKNNHLIFAVLLLIFSVIGAIYYLNIIKVMYFDKQEIISQKYILPIDQKIMFIFNSGIILLLGVFPSYLFEIIK